MVRIVVAEGFGKNPFAKFSQAKITAVLDKYAEEARKRFVDHGRYFTGGINPRIERPDKETRIVGSDDQRVIWTSLGTRDHYIAPRNGTRLAFSANYAAKTAPSVIPSRPGGPYGPTVYSTGHVVSGIEPRNVHILIAAEVGPRFVAEIRRVSGL